MSTRLASLVVSFLALLLAAPGLASSRPAQESMRITSRGPAAEPAEAPAKQPTPPGSQALRLDDGIVDTVLGVTNEETSNQAVYLNRFSPDPELLPITIDTVSILFPLVDPNGFETGLRPRMTFQVLVYVDEVAGYAPPTAEPATKKPIMTILKQARAFGVGMVLATQNPVDLDYKALSNAGTWMIGRLQTEQDKQRLLDGMSAAAGGVDIAAVGDTIAGLGKRQFVLRRAGKDRPELFATRWAMSYLRGPLTRDQIDHPAALDGRGLIRPVIHDELSVDPHAHPVVVDRVERVGLAVCGLDLAGPPDREGVRSDR